VAVVIVRPLFDDVFDLEDKITANAAAAILRIHVREEGQIEGARHRIGRPGQV
jgi:hypothetical protein